MRLFPRNALQRGYSNASVVLSVYPSIHVSHFDVVNTIENEPLCASSSSLADKLTMGRGWTLSILEVNSQHHRCCAQEYAMLCIAIFEFSTYFVCFSCQISHVSFTKALSSPSWHTQYNVRFRIRSLWVLVQLLVNHLMV